MKTQFFTSDSGDEFAILSKDAFNRLMALAEDAEDIAAGREARRRIDAGEDEAVPAEIADRLIDGENPVRVWREYRGLTVKALAEEVGISAPYLSQIEGGKREGTFDLMRRIADALKVSLDDL